MPTTLILGASSNRERYANKAQNQLLQNGHQVILVNPKGGAIEGIDCLTDLNQVDSNIDTVTIYVKPDILVNLLKPIAKLIPRRVIFNPGTELKEAADYFIKKEFEVVEACTLVLLTLGTY